MVLITGASGYIGSKLATTISSQGIRVHALVRSNRGNQWLKHPNISIFKGDILQKETVTAAAKGCRQVYHVAARVGAWAKDPREFYDVNVEGTRNVLDAALDAGVEKLVFTSTSGVLGPSNNEPINEQHKRTIDFSIDYDHSKKLAEDLVLSYAEKGLNSVIVQPSKVYGPGHTSHSLAMNAIIKTFLSKKLTFIPSPGSYQVCFAFVDDVVTGHILAMNRGVPNEKYILGGINISYFDFFNSIRAKAKTNARIIKVSKPVVRFMAHLQELRHKLTGASVRFPVKSVDHAFSNYTFSSEKAVQELGYTITPIDEAIIQTIQFLKDR
jgi:nucleoside-diphosphate-sugar epimerase